MGKPYTTILPPETAARLQRLRVPHKGAPAVAVSALLRSLIELALPQMERDVASSFAASQPKAKA